ncbi:hydrolase [Paenibacillus selenitireducens]|uniref:Hydrolase n=1 Tax=Paenibacillus selenitireducens TaxID=1324314 RepID=A0A1T2XLK1_9BACL|nr:amidohydrolase [Paenibacillus selenitireducens]OPA80616.1 hydrolase [Paenibacillus selenitireducens]
MEHIVNDLDARLVEIRRHLHQYPEVAHEEFETTKSIRQWLEQAGISILELPLATGVIAEVRGKLEGPVIAIRADIDALPIQEATELPYASRIPGKMHACGHDFHTAAVLGAAYLLKEREQELQGTVRFLFQPAEEKGTGALHLIELGVLEEVQAIFGMHNKPDLPVGTVGIREGSLMASVDGFEIVIEGVGTHAAVPDGGVDPIVVSAQVVTALQSIVSRNVSSLDSAVVSVSKIHSGTTWNVIPQNAVLEGTIRSFRDEVRERVLANFSRIVHGVAEALGAAARIRFYPGPPAVQNDKALTAWSVEAANEAGLHVVTPQPSPGGEDFAFYQQQIPGSFVFMGTSGNHEWHHPSFTVDEQALSPSARYFAILAERALARLVAEV